MQMKMFTVDEANRALPVLREVIGLVQERMKWLAANKPQVEYMVEEFRIPVDSPVPGDYFSSLLQVRKALGKVESLGCQLKDIQKGLVDFPARLEGKNVLLCWCVGEDSVSYYHDLEAGYAGRRPIPDKRTESERGPEGGPSDDSH